jgi:hypothetical protein
MGIEDIPMSSFFPINNSVFHFRKFRGALAGNSRPQELLAFFALDLFLSFNIRIRRTCRPIRTSRIMNQIIEDLKDPTALPENTLNVNVVQTHISIVFVADSYVIKLRSRWISVSWIFQPLKSENTTATRKCPQPQTGQGPLCGCSSGNPGERKTYPRETGR